MENKMKFEVQGRGHKEVITITKKGELTVTINADSFGEAINIGKELIHKKGGYTHVEIFSVKESTK